MNVLSPTKSRKLGCWVVLCMTSFVWVDDIRISIDVPCDVTKGTMNVCFLQQHFKGAWIYSIFGLTYNCLMLKIKIICT